ncbi:MAG: mechanosensitive ion channel [Nitrospiraceae bacterium]|nr:mechanosensitive ion channel [Nitrospiraceae bacterium]
MTRLKVQGILLLFFLAVLMVQPSVVWSQRLPQSIAKKDNRAVSQGKVMLPATDEEIDKALTQLKARLEYFRRLSSETAETEAGPHMAAPEESEKRQRLITGLLLTVDKHMEILRALKVIRKADGDRAVEVKAWQGFKEKPPFPIAFLDSLRDSVLSQRLDMQTLELRLTVATGELQRFTQDLRDSQKEVRLAKERVDKSQGTSTEARQRWLLDLARLQNDLNEAGATSSETQRLVLDQALANRKEYIRFLEQKLVAAEKVSPLSKTDLGEKLQELDLQRKALNLELEKAFKKSEDAARESEKVREALNKTQVEINTGLKPTQKQRDRLSRYELSLKARQVLLGVIEDEISIVKTMLLIVDSAQKMWEDRYWLTQKRDLSEIRQKIEDTRMNSAQLQLLKQFVESRLSSWAALVRSQETRVEKGEGTEEVRQADRLLLKAYEERQALLGRMADSSGRIERLATLLHDELVERVETASTESRLKEAFSKALSFISKLWNAELYVAEESVIAEGSKIVKPVGVTVGKVIQALVILILGTLIARWLIRPVRWLITKKVKKPESTAEQVGKVAFFIMFLGILVFALVSVNIPLAVFTFLGGALAIGVGFGAQNIINNFMSGLILLFDRSITVDDIVEVDGQGGRVVSIGMRSSHIVGFDGVELLVPNSQFLQQKVTNWTLSVKRRRYTISLDVAYGSPTREVTDLMLKAVQDHGLVLQDPEPVVLFESFAESGLTFSVCFWLNLVSTVENRIVLSDIRHTITELFDKAGIVFAFPQRDVHLDASRPIEVKLVPPGQSSD